MVPKIQGLTRCCGECHNYRYDSGNAYECAVAGQIVRDKSVIAPFCPLADYPSGVIASQEMTIRALREPHVYDLGFTLLSHIAAKLGILLDPRGKSVTLELESGEFLTLDSEYITDIEPASRAIRFVANDETYRLFPDARPPVLYRSVQAPRGMETPEGGLWRSVSLKR